MPPRERQEMQLGSIRVRAGYDRVEIRIHPYYRSLRLRDPSIYEEYVQRYVKTQKCKKSGTWHGYLKVARSIQKRGFIFNKKDLLILKLKDGRWCCHHGRHRLCIMAYLYGPTHKIITQATDARHRIVTGITPTTA